MYSMEVENTQRILGPRTYQPIGVICITSIDMDLYCREHIGRIGLPPIHGVQNNSYRVAPQRKQTCP